MVNFGGPTNEVRQLLKYSIGKVTIVKDNKLTDEEIAQERKANNQALEAVDLVIFGKNDTFTKKYMFKELHLSIHLSVKYPNARQQGGIAATRAEILRGTEQSYYTNRYYETLININELGSNTKVFMLDDDYEETEEIEDYFSLDGYPRPDVVNTIADDLLVWMSRFRG